MLDEKEMVPFEFLICSFGGVGTTFFINFVKKYKKTNSPADRDGFKHQKHPPKKFKHAFKAIYIFGDPFNALISIFNRNFQREQLRKISKPKIKKFEDKIVNLLSYLNNGKDLFRFENHFDCWAKSKVRYPILFIKYENI